MLTVAQTSPSRGGGSLIPTIIPLTKSRMVRGIGTMDDRDAEAADDGDAAAAAVVVVTCRRKQ